MTNKWSGGFLALLIAAACSTGTDEQVDSASGLDTDPVSPEEIPDREDVHLLMAGCLQNKGWNATVREGPGGAVHIDVATEEQRGDVQAAMDECNEELIADGVIPHPDRPPSEEMVRDMFERDLELHACLADHGFSVPDVPSFDAYLDGVLAGEGESRWDPLSDLYATARAGVDNDLDDAFHYCVEG